MKLFRTKRKFIDAIEKNDIETVKKYLADSKRWANFRFKWKGNLDLYNISTPLHRAADYGHAEIATLLVEAGASVSDRISSDDQTPLFTAIARGSADTVKAILLAKPDLELVQDPFYDYGTGKNKTALRCAYGRRELSIFEILLEAGAKTNDISLFKKLDDKDYSYYQALVKAGAQPEKMIDENSTSLFEFYLKERLSSGFLTIDYKYEPSGRIVQDMVSRGKIDVNAPLSYLNRPLHIAIETNNPDLVQLLLSLGADPMLKNAQEKTAFNLAEEITSPVIKNLLYLHQNAPVETPAPETAPENTETWQRIGLDKIMLISGGEAAGKRITEIFNFKSHMHYIHIDDLKTQQQSISSQQPFHALHPAAVKEAFDAYHAAQGPIAEDEAIGHIGGFSARRFGASKNP